MIRQDDNSVFDGYKEASRKLNRTLKVLIREYRKMPILNTQLQYHRLCYFLGKLEGFMRKWHLFSLAAPHETKELFRKLQRIKGKMRFKIKTYEKQYNIPMGLKEIENAQDRGDEEAETDS